METQPDAGLLSLTPSLPLPSTFPSYQRLEESKRHAHSARSSSRLDQGVQVDFTEDPAFTAPRETVVTVGTMTEEKEQNSILKERLSRLEEEKAGLVERLSSQE